MATRTATARRSRHTDADIEAAKAFFLLSEAMHARLTEVASQCGMTHQQAHLLYLAGEGASMRELSERLGCDPSNVTGLADRLEERGLVERRRAVEDRRVTVLVRTAEGSELATELEDAMFDELPIYQGLTAKQRRELQDLLVKVIASQENLPTEPDVARRYF